MTTEIFIGGAGLGAVLTVFVTIAGCIISYVQGIKKIKTDNFAEVYKCLKNFSKAKIANMNHCNLLITKMTEKMPNALSPSAGDIAACRSLYHDFHAFLADYSAYLESLMSFYHFLYKDKPNIPATKEECWEILRLYALFTDATSSIANECALSYLQIISLLQFIKTNSGVVGRTRIYLYFKKNGIFPGWVSRVGKAFF